MDPQELVNGFIARVLDKEPYKSHFSANPWQAEIFRSMVSDPMQQLPTDTDATTKEALRFLAKAILVGSMVNRCLQIEVWEYKTT